MTDLSVYLKPTYYIDFDAPSIANLSKKIVADYPGTDAAKAAAKKLKGL